ncbi:hypothetical protein [Frateuria sp.]|uniref:hypothetical protein n=1 Tax=Frateuria sp. TaxID=2211372 RepID=UPI003F7E96D6
MHKNYGVIILLALASLSTSAYACRDVSLAQAYASSDIALVGFVSSVSIPSLEQVDNVSSETALGRVAWGERLVRVVVSDVRKGSAGKVQTLKVSTCRGAFVEPGDRVIGDFLFC